jgi:RHS repeat-associated protein
MKLADLDLDCSLAAMWGAFHAARCNKPTEVVSRGGTSTVVQTLDYYPFGAQRIRSGSSVSDRQFIGERYDANTDLNYLNARYYDSSRGQFISQDPTFWALKMNLNDPQSLNSYSYANDNPITKKDADGLAATVAQQIQVLQAQVRILQGIVSLYQNGMTPQANSAFATYQSAFGGSLNTGGQSATQQPQQGSIQTWRPNSTGGTTQMPNITNSLNKDMRSHAADQWINNPLYFFAKERTGGDWDLKNTPEYSSQKYPLGFSYDGQHVSSDPPG